MDLGTGIIGIIFLVFCIVIFIILSRSNRKREKELFQSLKNLARQNNCKITRYDIWNNSAIGIDNIAHEVFAIRDVNNQAISFQVNLSEMQKCRAINTNRRSSNKEDNFKVIEKLELAFTFRDKNNPETSFDFYNAEYDTSHLNGELQLIEKWCKIANDQLAILSLKK